MAFSSLFSPKDPQDKELYDYIHNIFGFYPKNIALYRVAFTHKSVSAETVGNYHVSNERMVSLSKLNQGLAQSNSGAQGRMPAIPLALPHAITSA